MINQTEKKTTWDFAIGLQAVDDKTPSPLLKQLAADEIEGKITTHEIITIPKNHYGIKTAYRP